MQIPIPYLEHMWVTYLLARWSIVGVVGKAFRSKYKAQLLANLTIA